MAIVDMGGLLQARRMGMIPPQTALLLPKLPDIGNKI
tara:strand:- start:47 stop:157 length:111 start_codon:yes stop_codon:yes gene_type:complete